ncbi:hypothetical protein H6P81_011237 [Aristolochia fimbriata]|uniref:Gnk2-homologous domain-containing protein n=1 Tax=Aristolochia fimbriata TaxID=158543 RepID=A0AAV7EUF8_ARIFI|nr:hypothetical protein H6P81_011237 [Aristolochia fimbriata]
MAAFRLLSPLFFLLPLFLPASTSSLLAFNCSSLSSPLSTPTQAKQSLKTLLQNLTVPISTTQYAASSISSHLHAFLQCRPHLSSTQCRICAHNAVEAMAALCSSSASVSAWFDDCYIQYYDNTSSPVRVFASRANRSTDAGPDPRRFDLALNTLVLQLRAETQVATRRGFSSGEIEYGYGRAVFTSMECLRFLTPEACDACLAAATARSRRCCGGAAGVAVVEGGCVIRYDTYRFFDVSSGSGSGPGGKTAAVYEEGEDGKGGGAARRKVVVGVWWACFFCAMGFCLGCWVLRRRVAFTSKVGSVPVEPTK